VTFLWHLVGRADCLGAAALARSSLVEGGWTVREASELAVVVAELTSNAVRHAGGGKCTLEFDQRQWVLTVHDEGPGFPARILVDAGQTDGVQPRVGLGAGLSCARRLSGELRLENLSPTGALVIAHKQRGVTS
jgi:anti-sigma regulatory factor (Ser/Thr protein kinase)